MAKIDKTETVENAPGAAAETVDVASKTTSQNMNAKARVLYESGYYVTSDGSKFNTLKKAEQHLKQ